MDRPVRPPRQRGRSRAADPDDLVFRTMVDDLPSPCWMTDAEGVVIWVNKAWIAYTGMTLDDIARETLAPLHDPEMLPKVRQRLADARASGEPTDMVFPLRGRDGAFRMFHTHVAPLRDRRGRASRWFGVNTDVSDQARVEASLRSREEEFREVFERAGDSIFVSTAEGDFTEANPAACELLGYTREELLKLNVAHLVDPDELPRAQSVRVRARDEAISGVWRLRRKDGGRAHVEISSRVLSDGRQIGVARDVSERLRREEDLRARADAAESRLRRFWDVSRDLFAIVSRKDGVPLFINEDAWREVLGYPPDRILGKRLTDLEHPDDRERTHALRAPLDEGRSVFGVESRFKRADGAWVWLSWNVVAEGDDQDFAIARDISEEKARAAHAEQAQRLEALGKLTGGVAHDFNNLLMTILGALDLMQRRPHDGPLRDRLMTAALAAVRRGEQLNKQLLSFARKGPAGRGVTDARALLEDMHPLLNSALGDETQLRYELARGPCGCAIEPSQLEAAVLNLIVNARDAMPKGGVVTIRTRNAAADEHLRLGLAGDDGHLVIEVMDTGEGMPRDVVAHAFEPFFTTKAVGEGSGLGLSQVYGAARQSGGLATAESEPGVGTTVRMYLRMAPLPATVPVEADAPRADPGDSVLLVEDDVLVGVVTESLLVSAGYQVTRANNAVEALAALRGGRFDVMVTDVRMPGAMNGVDLAREATRRNPRLKVLLCSGWTAENLGPGVSDAPWPLLSKPYDEAQLRRALDDLRRAPQPSE
jgi:PAS domain S-box-containing protein